LGRHHMQIGRQACHVKVVVSHRRPGGWEE
jgi:hypothetical protein